MTNVVLSEAITAASIADAAFEVAIRDAGYRSRWDWSQVTDRRPMAAYLAKVKADEAMHEAFEDARRGS